MKKSLYVLLLCALVGGSHTLYAEKSYLRGEVYVPKLNDTPKFHAFWAGEEAIVQDGLYTFHLDENKKKHLGSESFSLMVSKDVVEVMDENDVVVGLRVTNAKPGRCMWYDLDREYDETKKKWFWRGTKLKAKKNQMVPDDCILILLNTKYVDEERFVKNLSKSKVSHPQAFFLPRVFIKRDAVDRMQIQSTNRSLGSVRDITSAHERVPVTTTEVNGVLVQS